MKDLYYFIYLDIYYKATVFNIELYQHKKKIPHTESRNKYLSSAKMTQQQWVKRNLSINGAETTVQLYGKKPTTIPISEHIYNFISR